MDKPKSKYPYLGIMENGEGQRNVVFFTSRDEGVVVYDETGAEGLTFGTNDTISEEQYEPLDPEVPVTMRNEREDEK